MAEAFYNSITGTHDAVSAGVDLANSVKGDDLSVPPLVVAVMQEVGLDVSSNRRKWLTKEMVEAADKVIVMTDYPLLDYLVESPKLIRWDEVPDAVRTPIEFHREVRNLVKKKVEQLISELE